MKEKTHKTRQATRDWIGQINWGDAVIMTLTFPPAIAMKRDAVVKNLKHYWNMVDAGIYGNLSRRKLPFRCKRFCVIEDGANRENHHCHAVLKVPDDRYANESYTDTNGVLRLLRDTWVKRMPFNIKQSVSPFDLSPVNADEFSLEQWQSYMTKTVTDWNADAICTQTSWLSNGQEIAV